MDACPYGTLSHFPCWSGAPNWLFCLKLGSSFVRKDTVLIIRRSNALSEALIIIVIHLWEVRKQSSSNGCLSLRHSVTYPMLIWYPNIDYFAYRFESSIGTNNNVLTIRGSDTLSEVCTIILVQSERVWNTQEAMYACPFNTAPHFPGWSGAPNWIFCLQIWEWFWEKRRHCIDHKGGQVFCLWHFQSFLYNKRG